MEIKDKKLQKLNAIEKDFLETFGYNFKKGKIGNKIVKQKNYVT